MYPTGGIKALFPLSFFYVYEKPLCETELAFKNDYTMIYKHDAHNVQTHERNHCETPLKMCIL